MNFLSVFGSRVKHTSRTSISLGMFAMLLLGCSGDPEIILPDGQTLSELTAELEANEGGKSYAETLMDPTRHPLALARLISEQEREDSSVVFNFYLLAMEQLARHGAPENVTLDYIVQLQWHVSNTPLPEFSDTLRYEREVANAYLALGRDADALAVAHEIYRTARLRPESYWTQSHQESAAEIASKAGDLSLLEDLVEREFATVQRVYRRAVLAKALLDRGEELRARRLADDIAFSLSEIQRDTSQTEDRQEQALISQTDHILLAMFQELGQRQRAVEALQAMYIRDFSQVTEENRWQFDAWFKFIEKFAELGEFDRAHEILDIVIENTVDLLQDEPEFGYYFAMHHLSSLLDLLEKHGEQEQEARLIQSVSTAIASDQDEYRIWGLIVLSEALARAGRQDDLERVLQEISSSLMNLVDPEERAFVLASTYRLFVQYQRHDDAQRALRLVLDDFSRQDPMTASSILEIIGESLLQEGHTETFKRLASETVQHAPFSIHSLTHTLAKYQHYVDALEIAANVEEPPWLVYLLMSLSDIYLEKRRVPGAEERALLKQLKERMVTLPSDLGPESTEE